MIFLRLHQTRNEEIEAGCKMEQAGWKLEQARNFAIIAKFCYNSEISAMYSNFAT